MASLRLKHEKGVNLRTCKTKTDVGNDRGICFEERNDRPGDRLQI